MVAGESCSSVGEHWHGKPKALGLAPDSSTFLFCLFHHFKGIGTVVPLES